MTNDPPHISDAKLQHLVRLARDVRENAYAPYSKFKVGAALLTKQGAEFTGCNVENVAYPEGTCAEAGAIAAMIANAPASKIEAVVVIADCKPAVSPCGGCRQKLAEFGTADTIIILADLNGPQVRTSLGDLLPGAFSQAQLEL